MEVHPIKSSSARVEPPISPTLTPRISRRSDPVVARLAPARRTRKSSHIGLCVFPLASGSLTRIKSSQQAITRSGEINFPGGPPQRFRPT